jgi:hypothetical protein
LTIALEKPPSFAVRTFLRLVLHLRQGYGGQVNTTAVLWLPPFTQMVLRTAENHIEDMLELVLRLIPTLLRITAKWSCPDFHQFVGINEMVENLPPPAAVRGVCVVEFVCGSPGVSPHRIRTTILKLLVVLAKNWPRNNTARQSRNQRTAAVCGAPAAEASECQCAFRPLRARSGRPCCCDWLSAQSRSGKSSTKQAIPTECSA